MRDLEGVALGSDVLQAREQPGNTDRAEALEDVRRVAKLRPTIHVSWHHRSLEQPHKFRYCSHSLALQSPANVA
jgi:hypothetical protein